MVKIELNKYPIQTRNFFTIYIFFLLFIFFFNRDFELEIALKFFVLIAGKLNMHTNNGLETLSVVIVCLSKG